MQEGVHPPLPRFALGLTDCFIPLLIDRTRLLSQNVSLSRHASPPPRHARLFSYFCLLFFLDDAGDWQPNEGIVLEMNSGSERLLRGSLFFSQAIRSSLQGWNTKKSIRL